jgi:hypothetical protein
MTPSGVAVAGADTECRAKLSHDASPSFQTIIMGCEEKLCHSPPPTPTATSCPRPPTLSAKLPHPYLPKLCVLPPSAMEAKADTHPTRWLSTMVYDPRCLPRHGGRRRHHAGPHTEVEDSPTSHWSHAPPHLQRHCPICPHMTTNDHPTVDLPPTLMRTPPTTRKSPPSRSGRRERTGGVQNTSTLSVPQPPGSPIRPTPSKSDCYPRRQHRLDRRDT